MMCRTAMIIWKVLVSVSWRNPWNKNKIRNNLFSMVNYFRIQLNGHFCGQLNLLFPKFKVQLNGYLCKQLNLLFPKFRVQLNGHFCGQLNLLFPKFRVQLNGHFCGQLNMLFPKYLKLMYVDIWILVLATKSLEHKRACFHSKCQSI